MQHVEFFHRKHFEQNYYRQKAVTPLSHFIDFFWETRFDHLYRQHPGGFSDALFPNVGYTYLVNLGTPFTMQLGEKHFKMKGDGFLPRHRHMICHHSTGNRIFGIKFRVSPVLLLKKVDFSEYREYIYPLSYLIEPAIIAQIKAAGNFRQRVSIVTSYYKDILSENSGKLKQAEIVTSILNDCNTRNEFDVSIEALAAKNGISSRTLQRYFETTTSISSKQALQIMRIRKALESLILHPESFRYRDYGYYDYSHFSKHLKQFFSGHNMELVKPHLGALKEKA